jgi:hypothetical protein
MTWRMNLARALVFVPSAVFVNDVIVGLNEVTGDTGRGPPSSTKEKSLVLVSRVSSKVHNNELKQGDVVVITDPHDSSRNLVRTVVRCGKEWVRVHDGDKEYHVYVQQGYCWVEGRAAPGSEQSVYDSKSFGPISMGLIQGIPMCVVWPGNRLGLFPISQEKRPEQGTA